MHLTQQKPWFRLTIITFFLDFEKNVIFVKKFERYSCTLLAYGQTGSGKTHTMFGPPGVLTESALTKSSCPPSWGIFPRIALELLSSSGTGTLHASAIEVYQDNAYDLLADRAPLQVGTKSVGRQVGGGGAIIANASKEVSAGTFITFFSM